MNNKVIIVAAGHEQAAILAKKIAEIEVVNPDVIVVSKNETEAIGLPTTVSLTLQQPLVDKSSYNAIAQKSINQHNNNFKNPKNLKLKNNLRLQNKSKATTVATVKQRFKQQKFLKKH